MHYKKMIVLIVLLVAPGCLQSITESCNTVVCDELESFLASLSDSTELVDYDKQPISQQTTSLLESVKIKCRKFGIILLTCAVDTQQWLIKTKAKIGLWLSDL